MVICEPQKKKNANPRSQPHLFIPPPQSISVLESSDLWHHTNYL